MNLRLIGYWRDASGERWRDPVRLVDRAWDGQERERVGRYFSHGTIARAFMGRSTCRICGVQNGSLELTDGRYVWPEGFAHYIDEHGVRPPLEIVEWALSRLDELDDLAVDDTWWAAATTDR